MSCESWFWSFINLYLTIWQWNRTMIVYNDILSKLLKWISFFPLPFHSCRPFAISEGFAALNGWMCGWVATRNEIWLRNNPINRQRVVIWLCWHSTVNIGYEECMRIMRLWGFCHCQMVIPESYSLISITHSQFWGAFSQRINFENKK